MANYIVVRIVPQTPVDALTFSGYLSALGGLTITAYALDFATAGSQPAGTSIGSVSYNPISPAGFWSSDGGSPPLYVNTSQPPYPSGTTSGLVQQVDFGFDPNWGTDVFALEAVANAVIELSGIGTPENIQLAVQWAGQAAPSYSQYYDLTLAGGTAPDLSSWPSGGTSDAWAGLTPNMYISLPVPPGVANPLTLQLPSNGAPPAFDALLTAMQAVLNEDPGAGFAVVPNAAAAGATQLTIPPGTVGIVAGMVANAPYLPAGTIVTAVSGVTVMLSQQLSSAVAGPVNFGANIAWLSAAQCLNIANEILWSQLPALPTPPEAVEDMYTNPPNNGSLLSGGNSVNQDEGDRQQFEAQLKSYYAATNANANQLANFIYAASAAVACEQMSLAAAQVLLEIPVNPGQPGSGPASEAEIILTGIAGLAPSGGFGVPAGYFYGLGNALPSSMVAAQRYKLAVGDQLGHLLTQLSTAIAANAITDAEAFVTGGAAAVNAAQAARRLVALGVPQGSGTALAPLGALVLQTSAATAMGISLAFASTAELAQGMLVSGAGIPAGASIAAPPGAGSITLSAPVLNSLPAGASVTFTPAFAGAAVLSQLPGLVQGWLAYPPAVPGQVSSQIYQPGDEFAMFWPQAATAAPQAMLGLVLSALTQGYVIPAPFDSALGLQILGKLSPPSLATLAAYSAAQWTALFTANPSWLPPGPGGVVAGIAAFIQAVRRFFAASANGPVSAVNLATAEAASAGSDSLGFASVSALAVGMSVSCATVSGAIPGGIVVSAVNAGTNPPLVTLSAPLHAAIPALTNILFTPNLVAANGGGLPQLQMPANTPEWFSACLSIYDSGFTFGSGISSPANLASAAASVFANDVAAQAWLVEAITAIDALTGLVAKAGYPVLASAAASPNTGVLGFSLVEALYACGFRSAADIAALSAAEFQQALLGSVAYGTPGSAIYAQAGASTPMPGSGGGFVPVNPDGELTNCIPPLSVSPLGPNAYLHELLRLSPDSSCAVPLVANAATTLGNVVAGRRGPLAQLLASEANLLTPLPMIDIVNENLEALGAALLATPGSTPAGVVYDTSGDKLAGFALCQELTCPPEPARCHDPDVIFDVLPEYSTPATPLPANAAVAPAIYEALAVDVSDCGLPYSQALDVNRTYVRHLRSCRFEEMRSFRRCITEFVLAPAQEPHGFWDYLWRYPVRVDIAIEYLGITPQEYRLIFDGEPVYPCGGEEDQGSPVLGNDAALLTPQLYGLDEAAGWTVNALPVAEFLRLTCLSYCEFIALWQSGYVAFSNGTLAQDREGARGADFPLCEPCCLDGLTIAFGRDVPVELGLRKLAVFIRLWRKLKENCGCGYDFAELRDICDVLGLFQGNVLNRDFIRQLAAFQMLRDDFRLALRDGSTPVPANAVDAERTALLALWATPQPATWGWAVRQLLRGIEEFAGRRFGAKRGREFIEGLSHHLDALSKLAGFNPASATDNWHAAPTHTLRFAEILAKIHASSFSLEEMIYLFTVDGPLGPHTPFALQDEAEALIWPLNLPETEHEQGRGHTLLALRHKLLAAEAPEDEAHEWHWPRLAAALQSEFGFADADVLALGQRFFPRVLDRSGTHVPPGAMLFISALAASSTNAVVWNVPANGPFHYDTGAAQLTLALPLDDAALRRRLEAGHDFGADEQAAIQDLYYQPRAMLANFALLFSDFAEAQEKLIEAHDEEERFGWFRRAVALARRRAHIIAAHLAAHAAAQCGAAQGDEAAAALILRHLAADENFLAPTAVNPDPAWENLDGTHPALTWAVPNGGALAGLLALAGTGLVGETSLAGGGVVWREPGSGVGAFGRLRNHDNLPVPCIVPALDALLGPGQGPFVAVHNGLLQKDLSQEWLGGAQGFTTIWSGALLIEHEGHYEFTSGDWTPPGEPADYDAAANRAWVLILKRGARSWVLASHDWPGEIDRRFGEAHLRGGAYEISLSLKQPAPLFASANEVAPVHTGLQVKYRGPDSGHERIQIPHDKLFQISKDNALGAKLSPVSAGAQQFLAQLYTGSLRDIRRTYQRAFKAVLFSHRLGLRAGRQGASELGTILSAPQAFAGAGYFQASPGAVFTRQLADLEFNYLPVHDEYLPPASDQRTAPSPQRVQALFDWWERLFDYSVMREAVHKQSGRAVWEMFLEAGETQPADAEYLLRQIGAAPEVWALEMSYFQRQNAPVYGLSYMELLDERWAVRAWHADKWLRGVQTYFAGPGMTRARPDLWASDDPSLMLPGESETGNANLLQFVLAGALETGRPRRYEDIKKLNDGLRERGRAALLAYLCNGGRVPLPWQAGLFAATPRALSDILLLDVQAGLHEHASRIEDAISAVQAYIRRARLGLEAGWGISREFARLWDREFASFEVWQGCKARHLYKENWLEWEAADKARQVPAFRFLEDRLKGGALSCAAPGGLEWWPEAALPAPAPELVQAREPSALLQLAAPVEGLGVIGTPERDARPSWLTAIPAQAADGNAGRNAAAPLLPLWMQAAIRLGKNFVRVAAAGAPPAGAPFVPQGGPAPGDASGCVSCCDCGGAHEPGIDEYYFWLVEGQYYDNAPQLSTLTPAESDDGFQYGFQDDYYDPAAQQSAYWEDPAQLPALLDWPALPMVRLAWCRVHNGQFGQPRRSHLGVAVAAGQSPALVFDGRSVDSLFFSVTNGQAPLGYASSPAAGFRYDMARDGALVLPQVGLPPSITPFAGQLPAYPYFAYAKAGPPAFPLSNFAPALAVARWLRAHCRFEPALRWYRLAYDPLGSDNTWIDCHPAQPAQTEPQPVESQKQDVLLPPPAPLGACCDSTAINCATAEQRAVLLHYVETLVEWGHALMRRRESPEAFAQARVLFDTARLVLGRRPRAVRLSPPAVPPQIGNLQPATPALNPRLLDLYEIVEDQLRVIREDTSAHRLRQGQARRDLPYFGDSPWREGWRTPLERCEEDNGWCHPASPYRFTFLIQKALEYAGKVQELGAELLGAFEKGDAEYLAVLRAGHEREILTISLAAKKDQWRDADWQIEALQKTKAVSQANLVYYTGLINAGPGGLINDEIQYESLMNSALSLRAAANAMEAVGEGLSLIPDFVVGAAGFGGSPVAISWLPLGTKLGGMFAAIARIINNEAQIESENAQLDNTEAGWIRRLAEWVHQTQILTIEIQQAERQILGAQRRRDQMLVDVNAHQRQIENAAAVQDFLRDKFSSHELYLYMQHEVAGLYYETYDLALHAARQAQRAFNLERGHTTRHFLPPGTWDDLHDGLLAGEKLSTALRHMEKAFFDENIREYELSKHVSLRLSFPLAYLRLRHEGIAEIDLPEWMFDQDFPGQYMRRIRNVSLTLPCVTGPYTGVHCRLTLLSSTTRIDPHLAAPAHGCCCPTPACCCGVGSRDAEGYMLCADDPRMVKILGARDAVATSTGQNDAGLFELSFTDPRYLPFEYMGAVSRWRIELPPENNYFDLNTLTDAVLHINYTAREGGEALRDAARAASRGRLPGDGWSFFDMRHDFPDGWELFRRAETAGLRERTLIAHLRRKCLPYLPGNPELRLGKFALLFETAEMAAQDCPQAEGCPCAERQIAAAHEIGLRQRGGEWRHFTCYGTAEWPGLYSGAIETDLRPFHRGGEGCDVEFRFPAGLGEVLRVYMLCEYAPVTLCCTEERVFGA